jgi:hypothetical protein
LVKTEAVPFVPAPPPPGAMVESPMRKILGIACSSRTGAAKTLVAMAAKRTAVEVFIIAVFGVINCTVEKVRTGKTTAVKKLYEKDLPEPYILRIYKCDQIEVCKDERKCHNSRRMHLPRIDCQVRKQL